MLRAVIFDLDDTLYEEEQFIHSGFRQVAECLEKQGTVPGGFLEQLLAIYEEGTRGNIFDTALKRMGVQPESDLVSSMVEIYRSHHPGIQLYPDASLALEQLDQAFILGLLSDGYATVQRNKIAALGIERYFKAVVLSDELGRDHWKPDPLPYLTMLERIGALPAEAVYIADNPAKDFVTARQLGMWTIRVRRARGQYRHVTPAPGYDAHLQISDLGEVSKMLLS